MTDRIGRLGIRWLPDAAPDEDRLVRLVERLVDESLPEALEEVGGDDLVCVRRVEVPTRRFRWEQADDDVLAAWAATVAGAVAAAARSASQVRPGDLVGPGADDALRFRSIEVAIADLVAGVLSGRHERAWAWRQLGLWPEDRSMDPSSGTSLVGVDGALLAVAVEHLLRAPHLVVPALLGALALGGPPVVGVLPPRQLLEVVEGAWHALGGVVHAGSPAPGFEDAVARARSVLARSSFAAAARAWVVGRPAGLPPEAVDALAVAFAQLAILEVEPAIAREASTVLVLELVADALGVGGTEAVIPPADHGDAPPAESGVGEPEPVVSTEPDEPLRTSWGGLLFLLHLVAGTPTRTVLHLAGLDLLRRLDPDVDEADPSVRAFAGALGDGVLGDPTDEDVELAAVLAVELLATLLQRVPLDPPATPHELLDLVCRRHAVVEHDPGWIDVLLLLDEVVVEVRAAGLDLDPGHLPWLGCVVRFRYV